MTKRRPIETSEDLVRTLADLFDEVELESPEEIDTMLRDAGYDPEEIGARMKTAAEQALEDSPFNWRNRAQKELEEERSRLEGFLSDSAEKSREEIIRAIDHLKTLLGGQAQQVHAFHRNLESESDEDLAKLLSELEYLASQQNDQDKKNED